MPWRFLTRFYANIFRANGTYHPTRIVRNSSKLSTSSAAHRSTENNALLAVLSRLWLHNGLEQVLPFRVFMIIHTPECKRSKALCQYRKCIKFHCIYKVINYAFVNSASKLTCISDQTFAYHGTWNGTTAYSEPLDVVGYNNGLWIATTSSTGSPPLGSASWSQLSLLGTINPESPFEIASTALATANGAVAIASAAYSTANEALTIAESGTSYGTRTPIAQGTNYVYAGGLGLNYQPSCFVCTIEIPNGTALPLTANPVGAISANGFTVRLSGTTDQPGYFLNWIAQQ